MQRPGPGRAVSGRMDSESTVRTTGHVRQRVAVRLARLATEQAPVARTVLAGEARAAFPELANPGDMRAVGRMLRAAMRLAALWRRLPEVPLGQWPACSERRRTARLWRSRPPKPGQRTHAQPNP